MSMIWTICGAGRGVGKTTLALKLREKLPTSIYVKCGHGNAKPSKPENYFNNISELLGFIETKKKTCKNIIIESNKPAVLSKSNVVIFIDGINGKTDFRNNTDKLREIADVKITPDATLNDWKKVFATYIESKSLCEAICVCLAEQKRYLFGYKPMVCSKLWFESAGAHIFGKGLAKLLENISHLGTLRDAAKEANMSYRYAWKLINIAEEHFGKKIIERHPGGLHRGGSALSKDGHHLLNVFKELNKEVEAFADERFEKLYAEEKVNV